jgi:hypothetical protein
MREEDLVLTLTKEPSQKNPKKRTLTKDQLVSLFWSWVRRDERSLVGRLEGGQQNGTPT